MIANSKKLVETAQHKLRIYNYISIGIATLLGGPVATAYLLSKNFEVFNRPDAKIVTWSVAVIIELGIIVSFITIPAVTDLSIAIPLIYIVTALLLTKIFQGRQMAEYYTGGGDAFSYGRGIGIGALILAITLILLFVALIMMLAVSGGIC